jgi:hypothetical protein
VKIDLGDTELENIELSDVPYGVGEDADSSGHDWLHCRRIGNEFNGSGGPYKLTEILEIFLKWANENKSPADKTRL